MTQNQQKIKEKYIAYRIKMKSLRLGEERTQVKKEMSDFLETVALVFGQDVVNQLTKKQNERLD